MSRDFPDNWPNGMPFPSKKDGAATHAPSEEELNHLRRDASQGDINAASFFRNRENADEALELWRKARES